jgi:hypothetical protein
MLTQRRERAVSEHREAAEARAGAAQDAEHRARLQGAVAERERAEARLHEEQARAHELGLADDDLMREDRGVNGDERRVNGDEVRTARGEEVATDARGRGVDDGER